MTAAKRPRDWHFSGPIVLHANDPEIPGQYVAIKMYGSTFEVTHHLGMYTVVKQDSRPTLLGAIRLAESWVR